MNVSIRQAAPEDYDAVCDIYQEIALLHHQHLPDRFHQTIGPILERKFFLSRLADLNVGFWVAEVEGQLLGYVQVTLKDTPPFPTIRPRHYCYIDEIAVKAGYRGKGIGQQLMGTAEAWAIVRGATSIELGVYEFNTEAVEFYQRLGYTTLHRRLNKALVDKRSP